MGRVRFSPHWNHECFWIGAAVLFYILSGILAEPAQAYSLNHISFFDATPVPPVSASENPILTSEPPAPSGEVIETTSVPPSQEIIEETPTVVTPTNQINYLPFVVSNFVLPYVPAEMVLYCNSESQSIPDDQPEGRTSTIQIADPRWIADLNVSLDVNHTWVGDLVVQLIHEESGRVVTLLDRPGKPDNERGCGSDNVRSILDDDITSPAEKKCSYSAPAIGGIYQPSTPLSVFDRESLSGTWNLTISDHDRADKGEISSWCLAASVSESPAPELEPPPVEGLPRQAHIGGITGKDQKLPLDCESRSAVDWAGYFGYKIDEMKFFNRLPVSDNPDAGFVGDVNGTWGKIPPNDYGVHAEPVAALLREYGVPAYAHRPLRWDQLQSEIAAGRPVFVWIIGSVYNGIPVYYTPSDHLHTVVARREHTTLVIGYSRSEVTILDGDSIYTRSIDEFLDSWSALGNMAITTSP